MELTQELLKELLHYDPDTGIFTWLHRDRKWFSCDSSYKVFKSRDEGKQTGSRGYSKKGCRHIRIRILGNLYFAHRLAWIYMAGKKPPKEVDHINGNGFDNRWANLRDGDNRVNHRNKCMLSNSTSGVMGVSWHKQTKKWRAYTKVKGRQIYLGLFENIQDAEKTVRDKRKELGFSERHGSPRPYDLPSTSQAKTTD